MSRVTARQIGRQIGRTTADFAGFGRTAPGKFRGGRRIGSVVSDRWFGIGRAAVPKSAIARAGGRRFGDA
jgi:hypothetical protein